MSSAVSIRAAIIGIASFYSVTFADSLRGLRRERVDLVGAAHLGETDDTLVTQTGLTRQAFSDRFGVRLFERVEDLLSEANPQLVFVCSRTNQRPQHAQIAVDAGADVFIAKPMAMSMDGSERIRRSALSHPMQLVGALNPARFVPAIREAHRLAVEGAIGEILAARAWIQHGEHNPARSRTGSAEQDDGQGGIELSLGVYAADLLHWFLSSEESPAVRAYAEYGTLNTPDFPWIDIGKALVRYGREEIGSMDIYYVVNCGAPLWEVEVVGRDGILRTTDGAYGGQVWSRSKHAPESFGIPKADTIASAVEHVVACCEERRSFEMNVNEGYRSIETCLAWRKSADLHNPVALPLVGRGGE